MDFPTCLRHVFKRIEGRPRVLVADEDPVVLTFLASTLESYFDAEVFLATDPLEAESELRQFGPFALVVSDFICSPRLENPEIPFVSIEEGGSSRHPPGKRAVLRLPCSEDQVVETVQAALARET